MTSDEFVLWMERGGWSANGIADALGISRRTVLRYRAGLYPIPARVEAMLKFLPRATPPAGRTRIRRAVVI